MVSNLSKAFTSSKKHHEAAMARLLETGEHSDLVLRCSDGKEFRVHKGILCAQSQFFRKACNPEHFKEGRENLVELTIGDSSIISLLLSFLYTTNFEATICPLIDVNLYVAADFYDIEPLRLMAAACFESHLEDGHWTSDFFPKAVETIYNETSTETSPNLRNTAFTCIVEHASELMKPGTNGTPSALAIMMDTIPELSKDIAMHLLFEAERLKSATPPKNGTREIEVDDSDRCACGAYQVPGLYNTDCTCSTYHRS
ncbi:hypothetical protein EG328_008007 [Venturia inaequalis]|uniref:BTB domain-containing protein n=1 Tax=Venturia inaequalis TaxID=5025 RepID=A0A8H3VTJ2_VENIN|nr:hypothetical protein EG328_008007 [Venturia inaequalis]KAE9992584.1 hypothetical protein EG327_008459 [Venturia inaequalis]